MARGVVVALIAGVLLSSSAAAGGPEKASGRSFLASILKAPAKLVKEIVVFDARVERQGATFLLNHSIKTLARTLNWFKQVKQFDLVISRAFAGETSGAGAGSPPGANRSP